MSTGVKYSFENSPVHVPLQDPDEDADPDDDVERVHARHHEVEGEEDARACRDRIVRRRGFSCLRGVGCEAVPRQEPGGTCGCTRST